MFCASNILSASEACCDRSEALRTGVYSNMRFNEDGGDLLGIEIWLLRSGNEYVVVFQSSEGAPTLPVVADALIENGALTFTVPAGNPYSGSTFTGYFSSKRLDGKFNSGQLAPDGNSMIHLTLGRSYWQR